MPSLFQQEKKWLKSCCLTMPLSLNSIMKSRTPAWTVSWLNVTEHSTLELVWGAGQWCTSWAHMLPSTRVLNLMIPHWHAQVNLGPQLSVIILSRITRTNFSFSHLKRWDRAEGTKNISAPLYHLQSFPNHAPTWYQGSNSGPSAYKEHVPLGELSPRCINIRNCLPTPMGI